MLSNFLLNLDEKTHTNFEEADLNMKASESPSRESSNQRPDDQSLAVTEAGIGDVNERDVSDTDVIGSDASFTADLGTASDTNRKSSSNTKNAAAGGGLNTDVKYSASNIGNVGNESTSNFIGIGSEYHDTMKNMNDDNSIESLSGSKTLYHENSDIDSDINDISNSDHPGTDDGENNPDSTGRLNHTPDISFSEDNNLTDDMTGIISNSYANEKNHVEDLTNIQDEDSNTSANDGESIESTRNSNKGSSISDITDHIEEKNTKDFNDAATSDSKNTNALNGTINSKNSKMANSFGTESVKNFDNTSNSDSSHVDSDASNVLHDTINSESDNSSEFNGFENPAHGKLDDSGNLEKSQNEHSSSDEDVGMADIEEKVQNNADDSLNLKPTAQESKPKPEAYTAQDPDRPNSSLTPEGRAESGEIAGVTLENQNGANVVSYQTPTEEDYRDDNDGNFHNNVGGSHTLRGKLETFCNALRIFILEIISNQETNPDAFTR